MDNGHSRLFYSSSLLVFVQLHTFMPVLFILLPYKKSISFKKYTQLDICCRGRKYFYFNGYSLFQSPLFSFLYDTPRQDEILLYYFSMVLPLVGNSLCSYYYNGRKAEHPEIKNPRLISKSRGFQNIKKGLSGWSVS